MQGGVLQVRDPGGWSAIRKFFSIGVKPRSRIDEPPHGSEFNE